MATTTTRFKLTELNGLTRSVIFPYQPTWDTLSAKISLLYGIPIERVSVFYIDADNDQVTLSSQEELDDFYANFHQAHVNQAIKFTVQDLTSARLLRSTFSQTPKPSNIRNTFGIGAFDIEDDWQTLPIPQLTDFEGLFVPQSFSGDPPHQGFVETVPTDAGSISNHDDQQSVHHSSVLSSPDSQFLVSLDKGKERAVYEDSASSTASVLAESDLFKHPVHVYDVSALEQDVNASLHTPPIAAESTPKVNTQTVHPVEHAAETAKDASPQAGDAEDPPLPSVDENATIPTPSLSSDIANLLNTFSNVVAMHPELSEGVRNIVKGASSGTYWHAHREAISRAAQDIAQETGRVTEALRKDTEEEAGRRVAEALDGIFRSISQALGGVYVSPESTTTQTDDGTAPAPTATGANDASVPDKTPAVDPAPPVTEQPAATEPPHPHDQFNPWTHRGGPFASWGQRVPPPTWSLPPRGPFHYAHPPPPPPPPAMPGSWQGWTPAHGPPPPSPPPADPPADNKPSPQELRAQVDAAKARYKAEKERYRKERDERRKERERSAQVGPGATTSIPGPPPPLPPPPPSSEPFAPPPPPRPLTPPAIAVRGRSGNPTHEVVSLHRNHTHLGHSHNIKRHEGDVKLRAVHRITRRLADMGFTENAHPDLPSKIKVELPSDGSLTKEGEDNIVTTVLEDILARSPKPPVASGSGSREIPGSWH
ncbi:hypothetical protein DXG03_008484 [Asterophora parasitica]|uniref:PB1 domain-containing protein n=1 Tax=Asterophora parasitica TaxID=117018 RepID=A0A9P7KHG8_9AGAR|nr:hypothetical protein DXG03_008484 [Asterophora parasitica]